MPFILYSLDKLPRLLKREKPTKVCVVTSLALTKKLKWALKEIGATDIVLIPDGEKAKEWGETEKLLKQFIKLGLDRKSVIIALGGGTVGDAVGFAASIYLRGIRYIQVPTTLVAQVDSSHGAKTGINFNGYKNQVGSFYEPIAIAVDHRFISTLSREQLIDGLGEIIKAGYIKDASILALLRKHSLANLAISADLESIIAKSIKVKQSYIKEDPLDKGLRQMLNVGHTLGHAIELKHHLSHGKAVLIGMIQELYISQSRGFTDTGTMDSLLDLLKKLGIKLDASLRSEWKTILRDKKISGDVLEFPIVVKEGKSKLVSVKIKEFKKFI